MVFKNEYHPVTLLSTLCLTPLFLSLNFCAKNRQISALSWVETDPFLFAHKLCRITGDLLASTPVTTPSAAPVRTSNTTRTQLTQPRTRFIIKTAHHIGSRCSVGRGRSFHSARCEPISLSICWGRLAILFLETPAPSSEKHLCIACFTFFARHPDTQHNVVY